MQVLLFSDRLSCTCWMPVWRHLETGSSTKSMRWKGTDVFFWPVRTAVLTASQIRTTVLRCTLIQAVYKYDFIQILLLNLADFFCSLSVRTLCILLLRSYVCLSANDCERNKMILVKSDAAHLRKSAKQHFYSELYKLWF